MAAIAEQIGKIEKVLSLIPEDAVPPPKVAGGRVSSITLTEKNNKVGSRDLSLVIEYASEKDEILTKRTIHCGTHENQKEHLIAIDDVYKNEAGDKVQFLQVYHQGHKHSESTSVNGMPVAGTKIFPR